MLFEEYEKLVKKGTLELDESQIALLQRLQLFIDSIDSEGSFLSYIKSFFNTSKLKKSSGIYIHGDVGRGKSMLMDLFFKQLKTHKKFRVHFHEFMQKIHKSLNKWRKKGKSCDGDPLPKIVGEMISNKKVICLDELQINNIADAMLVSRVVKCIVDNGVYLFFTSNRSPGDLYLDGLQRDRFLPFIDYLKNEFQIFELENFKDYRLQNFKQIKQVYITPLGKKADKEIKNALTLLLDDHKMSEYLVNVDKSKSILVLRTYGKLAVFNFQELCGIPLGAIDYLALCKHFNTIIIENIPALNECNHNEALRFITLIDCMYESKTKLICSAAAEPEDLYSKGKNAFEFRRTVSRLKEMQSEGYILGNVN